MPKITPHKGGRTADLRIRLTDATRQELDSQINQTGAKSRADYITALVHDARGRTKRLTEIIQKLFGKVE